MSKKKSAVPEGADDIGRGDVAVDDAVHTKSGRVKKDVYEAEMSNWCCCSTGSRSRA